MISTHYCANFVCDAVCIVLICILLLLFFLYFSFRKFHRSTLSQPKTNKFPLTIYTEHIMRTLCEYICSFWVSEACGSMMRNENILICRSFSATKQEILRVTQQLLDAIACGDYDGYRWCTTVKNCKLIF